MDAVVGTTVGMTEEGLIVVVLKVGLDVIGILVGTPENRKKLFSVVSNYIIKGIQLPVEKPSGLMHMVVGTH